MQIRIESLLNRPRRVLVDEPAASFPLLHELAERGELTVTGPVAGDLLAVHAGELIEVEGRLSCPLSLPCSRCLQPVAVQIEVQVAWSFVREVPVGGEIPVELELSEEAVGLIPFAGETLDLQDAIAQELVMAIPQHPLCRQECAGLCPVCGGDRNLAPCSCTPPLFGGGFAALQGFTPSKKA